MVNCYEEGRARSPDAAIESVAGSPKVRRMLADLVAATGGDTASIVRFVDGGFVVMEVTHGPAVLGLKSRVPATSSTNFSVAVTGELFGTSDYSLIKSFDRPLDQLALAAGVRSACTVPLTLGAAPVAAVTVSSFQPGWDYTTAVQAIVEVGHRLVIELVRETDRRISSRLFICHEDVLTAEGLSRFGEAELGIKDAVTGTAIDDIAGLVESTSDLVVTDCYVGGERVDEQVRALFAAGASARVLVIASHDTDMNRAAAARANVYGYCPRTAGCEAIAEAFVRAGSGQFVPPMFVEEVDPAHALTHREREVLLLLEQGLQAKQVALTLEIARATVKSYIRNIFEKLDVHSTTMALHVARDNGLLDSAGRRATPTLDGRAVR